MLADARAVSDPAPSVSEAAQIWRTRLVFSLLATVVMAGALFVLAPSLLKDPDSWWQLRVGLDMLESRAFPSVDTYSYTFAGHPWIAKEWLSQVLLALAYEGAAWNGVTLLTAAAVLLTVFILCWQLGATLKPALAFGLALVLAFVIGGIFTARPHVLTLPVIALWTASLFRSARDGRPPALWLLALLWLWTNLHATFTLAFVVAGFAGLDMLARNRLTSPALVAKWCGFGVLCVLVSLLNPYGLKAILATFTVAFGNEAVPYITEWRAFNASTDMLQEAALLAALLGLLVSGLRVGWPRALFALFALHMYLTHERFVYVFFLLVPIVFAEDVAEQFPAVSVRTWARQARDGLERFFLSRYRALACAMAAVLLGGAAFFLAGPPIEPSQKTSARDALAFAAQNGLSGNVLNSYGFGGTLIFHGIKTFIDGRTDQLFLGGFTDADDATGHSGGKPLLEEQLGKYSVDWALLSADDDRIPFFDELSGWSRAYSDPYAVIYTRKR